MSRSRKRRSRNRHRRMSAQKAPVGHRDGRALGFEGAAARQAQVIRQYGWVVIGVYEHVERSEPPMAYTMGLVENFGHPELIIFGLPMEVSHKALNTLVRRFVRPGGHVPLGEPIDRVFERFPVAAKMLATEVAERYALMAERRARERSLPLSVVQIVWTDPEGRFPWESAYDRSFDGIQPRLFETGPTPDGNGKVICLAQVRAQRAGGCARAQVRSWH
ncbi:MAG: DUF4262 domain-containing protein [Steroidobacteraceae bacterium]